MSLTKIITIEDKEALNHCISEYKGKNTDVTINVNGCGIKAHSVILAMHSPSFEKKFFDPDIDDSTRNNIKSNCFVDCDDEKIINIIIDFIYERKITCTIEQALKAIEFSVNYVIKSVTEIFKQTIVKHLSIENVYDIYKNANARQFKDLKKTCTDFIIDALKITPPCLIQQIDETDIVKFAKIIRQNHSELMFVNIIISWIKTHNNDELNDDNPMPNNKKRKYNDDNKELVSTQQTVSEELLEMIDFNKLTLKEIFTVIAPSNLFSKDELYDIVNENYMKTIDCHLPGEVINYKMNNKDYTGTIHEVTWGKNGKKLCVKRKTDTNRGIFSMDWIEDIIPVN